MKNYTLTLLALTLGVVTSFSSIASVGGPYTDQRLSRSSQLIFMEEAYGVGVNEGRQLSAAQVDVIASSAVELRHTARVLDERSSYIETATSRVVGASNQTTSATRELALQQQDHAARMDHFDTQLSRNEGQIIALRSVDQDMIDTANRMLASADTVSQQRQSSAEIEAQRRIQEAVREADQIVTRAKVSVYDESTNYERVMNERVSCHLREVLVAEVFRCLVPQGWEADIDIANQDFARSMMSYTSDKPRRMAISDLVDQLRLQTDSQIRLSVNFYPRIQDASGAPRPLVIFSDGANR